MDRHELAWAAGFFDGEGWANRVDRGVQARINQADPDGVPELLLKFQRIVGVGRIAGPDLEPGRIDLYHWVVSSRADVTRVADLIGPWLCEIKRAQFEHALGVALPPLLWPGLSSEELAWAGGFFDGEGSAYLLKHRTHKAHLVPEVYVPQSGHNGIPSPLFRFRAALDGAGIINGPRNYKLWTPSYRWRTSALLVVPLVLHRLWPFIGDVKRSQAAAVLRVANTQRDLARGNPAFGAAGSRYCRRGHDKAAARIRPYRGRGGNQRKSDLSQCLVCVREDARARRASKNAAV